MSDDALASKGAQAMIERELFKVYDESDKVPQAGMFASLHTTAYDLQAWEYASGAITVEMHFKAGTPGCDDGALEGIAVASRDEALKALQVWGEEIQALENEEEARCL